jgi:regulatory protein
MNYNEALTYAMARCSRQETCRSEIRAKLEARKVDTGMIEKILETLVKEKFIDEARYARSFTRDKLRFSKWGKIKIRHLLTRKEIPENIIEEALAEIDPEFYTGILRQELGKKRKTIKGSNAFDLRGKLFRFASQRGFEASDIHRLLDEVI